MKPETFDKPSEKRSKLDQKSEKATTEHKFDVEGEIVETSTTSRSDETIALCKYVCLFPTHTYMMFSTHTAFAFT